MMLSPGDWVVRRGWRAAPSLSGEPDPSDGGQVMDRVVERRPGHPEHGQIVAVVVSWGSFSAVEQVSTLALLPPRARALLVCPYCGHRRAPEGEQWRCPRCGSSTPLPEACWTSQTLAHTGRGTCDHCHTDSLTDACGQLVCRRCRARGPRSQL